MTTPAATPTAQGAQGTAAQPAAQPASASQGQPTGNQGKGAFNWGLFPNVPEDQRPLMEPHLRDIQAHITKLEQQFAPFKAFADAGFKPEQATGLLQFAQSFDQDPLGMWMRLAGELQAAGVIDPDLDLEQVQAVASGQPDPAAAEQEVEPDQMTDGQGNVVTREEFEAFRNQYQQRETARQTQVEDQLLQRQMSSMKETLKEAGINVDEIEDLDNILIANIITAGGDPDRAVQQMTGFRDSVVKGTLERTDKEPKPLTMPKGSPQAPKKPESRPGDPFRQATIAASQALQASAGAAAQE